MRVAHVTIYPDKGQKHSHTSGVASYAKNLIESIRPRKGDEIFVLCEKLKGKRDAYIEDGVDVRRCFDRNPAYLFQLLKEIKNISPDVLHIQQELHLFGNILTAFLLPAILMLNRGRKRIVTLHGVVSLRGINARFVRENNSSLPVWLVRLAFRLVYLPLCLFSDKIIVHEECFKDVLVQEYGVRKDKIEVVFHGVEDFETVPRAAACRQLSLDQSKKTILFLGYATGYKGLDLLIEGFSLYAKDNPDAFLIIASGKHPKLAEDGKYLEEYSRLKKKARKLIPRGCFRWDGFIPEDRITLYYSAADVSVFPYTVSMSSSGPMALAIGYGRPFIASDVFSEVLDEKKVLFSRNPQALNEKLKEFFLSSSKRTALAKKLKRIRLWSVIGRKTYGIYSQDLSKKSKVLLLGSYGQTNLGDDGLMYSYLKMLSLDPSIDEEIHVNVNHENLIPEIVRHDFPKVKYFETYNTSIFRIIKIMILSDKIVFGGGTIIKELYSSTSRWAHAVTLRMLAVVVLAKLLGKKVFALNIGIGEVRSRFGTLIAMSLIRLFDLVTLRDRFSYLEAKKFSGVQEKKILRSLDGVFLLGKSFPVLKGSNLGRTKTVGINLLHDVPDHIDSKRYLRSVIGFINELTGPEGKRLIYFPFQNSFNINNDLDFFRENVLPKLKNPQAVEIIEDLNFGNLQENLERVDVFVGMRLHSLIFSFLSGKPFLALSYSEKCDYFLKEINYPYSVPLEKISHKRLSGQLEALLENRKAVMIEMAQKRNRMLEEGEIERSYILNINRSYA